MSKSIIKQKRILTKASGGSSLATPVSIANGGTGLSSYAVGDILYASGTTTLSKLPIGTASQQLRVNAGATALEYFTPAGSGITVGTTTITSGTSLRIPYNLGGVYQEQANFTIGSVAAGYLDVPSGYAIAGSKLIYSPNSGSIVIGGSSVSVTGIESTILSRDFNVALTGRSNTFVGRLAYQNGGASGEHNVGVGMQSLMGVNGSYNVMVGSGQNFGSGGSISYFTGIGTGSNPSHSSTIGIGYFGTFVGTTATHQGILGSKDANGYIDNWFFNGVTHTAAYSVVLNACGGSGTNNAGANLTLAAGKSTGSATPAVINFQSTAAGASSSTAQTLATVLQITNSTTITTSDAVNYTLGSTTGTKFGTANTQKLAFWNATPIVQPSGATQAAPAAYATGAFGLDSDANMQALYDLVVAMRTALVNVGIMKGSA